MKLKSELKSATVYIPVCQSPVCPTQTGNIDVMVNVLGASQNTSNVEVQLLWSGSIGQNTYIYRKDGDCSSNISNYSLIATVSGSERSYYDTIPSGVKITYRILSESVCGGQTRIVGDSSCVEVEASPQTGSGLGTVYFYITDHLGSVRAILDVDGNIKSTHDYEPFGVELQPLSDESTNLKYKYTGQERDNSTNLDYMHFRYYASTMGRFLKPDSVIPNAFNPQSWNLYSYVNGDPVNFNDPSGHYGNLPLGMKQTRLAPPGGSIWDMAMGMFYDESIDGFFVSYSDWSVTDGDSGAERNEKEIVDEHWSIETVFNEDPFTGLPYGDVSSTQFSEYKFDLANLAALGEARGIEIGFTAPSIIESKGFKVKADIGVTFGTQENVFMSYSSTAKYWGHFHLQAGKLLKTGETILFGPSLTDIRSNLKAIEKSNTSGIILQKNVSGALFLLQFHIKQIQNNLTLFWWSQHAF